MTNQEYMNQWRFKQGEWILSGYNMTAVRKDIIILVRTERNDGEAPQVFVELINGSTVLMGVFGSVGDADLEKMAIQDSVSEWRKP
jgi:hypothetical protein